MLHNTCECHNVVVFFQIEALHIYYFAVASLMPKVKPLGTHTGSAVIPSAGTVYPLREYTILRACCYQTAACCGSPQFCICVSAARKAQKGRWSRVCFCALFAHAATFKFQHSVGQWDSQGTDKGQLDAGHAGELDLQPPHSKNADR